jgi:hypothetical protein
VRQLPGDARFALKALAQPGVLIEVAEHQLDRDPTMQLLVERRIDDTHRTASDAIDNAVAADALGERTASSLPG